MGEQKKDWFKIYRSLLSDDIWLDEPFTKGQAWIDLIGRANYGTTKRFDGEHCIHIYRGQLPTSIVALSERWKWSRKKVKSFLKALSEAHMVSLKVTTKGTTVTIENYAFYQDRGTAEGTPKEHQKNIKRASEVTHKKNIQEETKNTQEMCVDFNSILREVAEGRKND